MARIARPLELPEAEVTPCRDRGGSGESGSPRWFEHLLAARQYTISAGTSELQRNIIGERVLGLPKG